MEFLPISVTFFLIMDPFGNICSWMAYRNI